MSNQIVRINNHDLGVKEYQGKRVVTFKDVDELHERVNGTADRNFRENKEHFIEREDYFCVKGEVLGLLKQSNRDNIRTNRLWTFYSSPHFSMKT